MNIRQKSHPHGGKSDPHGGDQNHMGDAIILFKICYLKSQQIYIIIIILYILYHVDNLCPVDVQQICSENGIYSILYCRKKLRPTQNK
jgi:hypothetical protein